MDTYSIAYSYGVSGGGPRGLKNHRPKDNFVEDALTRFQVTLWTKDDLIYIPERYRIRTTFIINVYCWTGARISAFFTGDFRYWVREVVDSSEVLRNKSY
jgi:hypothetical protein